MNDRVASLIASYVLIYQAFHHVLTTSGPVMYNFTQLFPHVIYCLGGLFLILHITVRLTSIKGVTWLVAR